MIRRDFQLILKRASVSRPSGEWSDDDFDVLADGVISRPHHKATAVPVGQSWMWTLAFTALGCPQIAGYSSETRKRRSHRTVAAPKCKSKYLA
jgi:hypothetical protein